MEQTAMQQLMEKLTFLLPNEEDEMYPVIESLIVSIDNHFKRIEKEQIIKAHYEGGIEFQEAKECRNQEVPYVNDAETYFENKYSQTND